MIVFTEQNSGENSATDESVRLPPGSFCWRRTGEAPNRAWSLFPVEPTSFARPCCAPSKCPGIHTRGFFRLPFSQVRCQLNQGLFQEPQLYVMFFPWMSWARGDTRFCGLLQELPCSCVLEQRTRETMRWPWKKRIGFVKKNKLPRSKQAGQPVMSEAPWHCEMGRLCQRL